VELTGLQQDTAYHYRVTTGSASSAIAHFRTMPASVEADSNFAVYSDMQEQGNASTGIHGRIVRESMTHHIPIWTGESDMTKALDFVLVPGDLVDSGPTYSDWKSQFFDEAQPLIQHVPYFTALGNHEQDHQNYYNFMNNPSNGSSHHDEQWYAFDHGNIRVITLNSNNTAPAQLTWLEDQLAETCDAPDIDFVFAQFHHAHISETWLPGQTDTAANFVNRLVAFSQDCDKASVHFYGHNHSYQRGQVRDHAHFYMDVSGAEGDLAYWGEYEQANSDIIQKSIVEWGWSFVEAKGGADPSFTMRRIGLGGEDRDYVLNFPGTEIDTLTYRPGSVPPLAPGPVVPSGGAEVIPDNVVLQASAFHGRESNASHLSSHFQVTTTPGDYSNPVEEQWFRWEDRYFKVNQNDGVDLTRTKDRFDLAAGTTYYWRVRYRDSGFKWSPWSAEATFRTSSTGGDPQTYTNDSDYAINDNTTVESPITVSGRSGNAPDNAVVDVDIRHTYKRDLKVDLVAPDGSTYNIHNRSGGSADNIIGSYTLDLSSEALNGTWKLRVNDNANRDTGYINLWSITF
jgi:hypothetical protein